MNKLTIGKFINLNDKKSHIILLLIFLSVFLINTSTIRRDHNWGGDFSQYIAQAKSLIDGTVDQLIEVSLFRYENSDAKTLGPLLYPWGFPILLAPVYYLFGFNIFAMKLFVNLFFFFTLAISHLIFKNRISNVKNILIIAIIAYNPYFFAFKENILSDIPFLFFSLFSIFLIQQFMVQRRYFLSELTSYLLIGIFMFVSYSIRSNGIILLPTLLFVQIIVSKSSTKDNSRKYLRNLKYSTPYIFFFICVLIIRMILPSKDTYSDQLTTVTLSQTYENVLYYADLLSVFFSTIIPHSGTIIYWITIPFVVLGVLDKLKEDYLYLIFSMFLVGLYIIWPGRQGLRFLFPIIPFYLYFLFAGLDKISVFLTSRKIGFDVGLVTGLSLLFLSLLTVSIYAYRQYNVRNDTIAGPYHKDSVQLFNYISQHTTEEDIIIFFKPRVMALYTNRKSAHTVEVDKIIELGVEYSAYEPDGQFDLEIEKFDPEAEKIFTNNTFDLYRLNLKP